MFHLDQPEQVMIFTTMSSSNFKYMMSELWWMNWFFESNGLSFSGTSIIKNVTNLSLGRIQCVHPRDVSA